jgi:putative transcriptional regulator
LTRPSLRFALALLVAVASPGTSALAEVRPEIGRLTGQLLVATEQMPDPRFMRTVVYLVQHDAGGAMGFVVNRPTGEVPLARILDALGIDRNEISGNVATHYGGPVDRKAGFVVHTADYVGRSTALIKDGVALTARPEIWQAIAAGTGPRRSRLFLGHCGWAPGQLEAEMRTGSWVTVPADESLIFDDDYDGKWPRAMARRRIEL